MEQLPTVPIESLSTYLRGLEWSDDGQQLVIEIDGHRFPVYFRFASRKNEFLTVLYNGAVDRTRSESAIVFQRKTWSQVFTSDVIHFCDPTLLPHPELTIGWGQLSPQKWAFDGYMRILRIFRKSLRFAPPAFTIHYGSSAGGFQALMAACLDHGSYALVNNPQMYVGNYYPNHRRRLFRDVFQDANSESHWMRTQPDRFSFLAQCKKQGRVPRSRVAINVASSADYTRQLTPMIEDLSNLGFTPSQKLRLELYWDPEAGHGALSKSATRKMLVDEQNRILLLNKRIN